MNTEAKRDSCGVRFDLIPGEVLKEVSEVFAQGAMRYGDCNWQSSRLKGEHGPINHALKHINFYNAGIPDDDGPDRKIHLKHAIVNLMFELYYELHPEKYQIGGEKMKTEIAQKTCIKCGYNEFRNGGFLCLPICKKCGREQGK